MRAFLAACVAAVLLATCGLLALESVQEPSGTAFSTEAVRIDPSWNWRQMFGRGTATNRKSDTIDNREGTRPYLWVLVDFGEIKNAPCTDQ